MLQPEPLDLEDTRNSLAEILLSPRSGPVTPLNRTWAKLEENFEELLKLQLELRRKAAEDGAQDAATPDFSVNSRKASGLFRRSTRKDISKVDTLDTRERDKVLSEAWLTEKTRSNTSKRRRDLCFKGVPVLLRGSVWSSAIDNDLRITQDLYRVLGEKVRESSGGFLRSSHGDVSEGMKRVDTSANSIALDVPRTLPELEFFHSGPVQCRDNLVHLLETYVVFRPTVGYSQGMSFPGAMLLLHMDDYTAFKTFANLIQDTCLIDFFTMKMPEVKYYLKTHDLLLQSEIPDLWSHLSRQGVTPDLYAVNWIMSLFCRSAPLELACRLWDIITLDGDPAIFRIAVGIMKHLSRNLMKCGFDEALQLLSKFPPYLNADSVLASVRSVSMNKKRFKQALSRASEIVNRQSKKLRETEVVVEVSPEKLGDHLEDGEQSAHGEKSVDYSSDE